MVKLDKLAALIQPGIFMHLHVLGICGTFMGSLAQLAVALGHKVTGSDANVYPPMSTQLSSAGIRIIEGFDPAQLDPAPDLIIVGNAISRGNPVLEAILNRRLPYCSGPQWLSDHVLASRKVLAVSGTHGKTTTSSMLAWILTHAGLKPGYLIGGVPENLSVSASLGDSEYFVIEADEYDSAFSDKRSKFVHYKPFALIINNLEYDHADIFPDLAAIQRQFHHVVRLLPSEGLVITPVSTPAIDDVLAMGCWTPVQTLSVQGMAEQDGGEHADWQARALTNDYRQFQVMHDGQQGQVSWSELGSHNMHNGLAAIAAAASVGVSVGQACAALSEFVGVKRRLQHLGEVAGNHVYDDFAHHPTAITATLAAMRQHVGRSKVIAVIEPRSNTMRLGQHQHQLVQSCQQADSVIWFKPAGIDWDMSGLVEHDQYPASVLETIEGTIACVIEQLEPNVECHIVIMSNGGFGGIHQRLLSALSDSLISIEQPTKVES